MKKTLISCMIVCLLFLTTNLYARLTKEYLLWLKGEFEIPHEIKKATNVSELKPFLDNKYEFTRMAAVRRLGEIGGSKTIELLVERFEKETTPLGMHDVPLVKLEVIRTLGRIGTDQAKSALIGMLKGYWQRGPKIQDKSRFHWDRDFSPVVPLLLETLYKWSSDKDVFETAKVVALSKDVKKYYWRKDSTTGYSIGQKAWEVYLKGDMISKGIVDEKDSAIYLLDLLDSETNLRVIDPNLGPLKRMSDLTILGRISEPILTFILKEAEQEFAKSHEDKFRRRIGLINKILREKAESEKLEISEKQDTSKHDQNNEQGKKDPAK